VCRKEHTAKGLDFCISLPRRIGVGAAFARALAFSSRSVRSLGRLAEAISRFPRPVAKVWLVRYAECVWFVAHSYAAEAMVAAKNNNAPL